MDHKVADARLGFEDPLRQQDVARLDVQVSNTLAVQIRQASCHVCGDIFAPAAQSNHLKQPFHLY